MGHPVIDKIIRDGVTSINVSMLSPTLRHDLMTEAGNVLMHMGRYQEAAQAFAIGGNAEQLREHGRWFLKQHKVGMAAFFLLHVEAADTLQDLAQECLAANEAEAAKAIYGALGDTTMMQFIEQNFAT